MDSKAMVNDEAQGTSNTPRPPRGPRARFPACRQDSSALTRSPHDSGKTPGRWPGFSPLAARQTGFAVLAANASPSAARTAAKRPHEEPARLLVTHAHTRKRTGVFAVVKPPSRGPRAPPSDRKCGEEKTRIITAAAGRLHRRRSDGDERRPSSVQRPDGRVQARRPALRPKRECGAKRQG